MTNFCSPINVQYSRNCVSSDEDSSHWEYTFSGYAQAINAKAWNTATPTSLVGETLYIPCVTVTTGDSLYTNHAVEIELLQGFSSLEKAQAVVDSLKAYVKLRELVFPSKDHFSEKPSGETLQKLAIALSTSPMAEIAANLANGVVDDQVFLYKNEEGYTVQVPACEWFDYFDKFCDAWVERVSYTN